MKKELRGLPETTCEKQNWKVSTHGGNRVLTKSVEQARLEGGGKKKTLNLLLRTRQKQTLQRKAPEEWESLREGGKLESNHGSVTEGNNGEVKNIARISPGRHIKAARGKTNLKKIGKFFPAIKRPALSRGWGTGDLNQTANVLQGKGPQGGGIVRSPKELARCSDGAVERGKRKH